MDKETRVETYLAEARKAEEQAKKAADTMIRESWLKLAEGYRHLAEQTRRP